MVTQFESAISEMVDSKGAVASNSATSSLHLACLALDIKNGDIVWTTPISFVASATAAIMCGAKIDFVDVDLKTGNLDPDLSIQIVSLLEKINRAGTTVVMATHDSSIVNRRKKRVIELSDGKIVRDELEGSYI